MTQDFSTVWLQALEDLLTNGTPIAPRGKLTAELPSRQIVVDMRRPVLMVPARKLSYQFMAAEAYWILDADQRVATIAPYNKRIAEFSDDGETFFGAYGPRIASQLQYVVQALEKDPHTRQAVLTIWRPNPPQSKDIPCTVAVAFSIREDQLHAHVFMRSSDIWLGVPYDVFNFSMLSHLVCGLLNAMNPNPKATPITPGKLYLTAASSHLYEVNWAAAQQCLEADWLGQLSTPVELYSEPGALMETLAKLRTSSPGDQLRWWEARG